MNPRPFFPGDEVRRPHRRVRPKPAPLPEVDPRRLPLDHPALESFDAARLIRRLRQRIRVSQRELAWRARVAHTTVARAESGELAPSLSTLQRLLAVGALHLVVVDERGRVVGPLPDREMPSCAKVRRYAHRQWDRHSALTPEKPRSRHASRDWEPPEQVA